MSVDPMFKKSVSFEWVIEHVDEHDDIQDHGYATNLSEKFIKDEVVAALSGVEYYKGLLPRLALKRDYGNEADGVIDRSYAYAYQYDEGVWLLPDETDMGNKVPDRFKKQLQRVQDDYQITKQKQTKASG